MDNKQKTASRSAFYDLLVWQRAMEFVREAYMVTAKLPKEEQFALASQLRRCSISIPSNIAEGSKRGRKEFLQFLRIASASAAEAETQLLLVKDLYRLETKEALQLLLEVERMLESFIKKLKV